jgi:thiol:disulfide interchange protein DsbC
MGVFMKKLVCALAGLLMSSVLLAQDAPVVSTAPAPVVTAPAAAPQPAVVQPAVVQPAVVQPAVTPPAVTPPVTVPAGVDPQNAAIVGNAGRTVVVDPSKGPPINDEDAVGRLLKGKYPKLGSVMVEGINVGASRIFEFQAAGMTGYTNANIDWILVGGELLSGDGATGTVNVTKKRAAEAGQRLFASLPLNAAIKYTYGKGERPILVFSDPDCPFCQDLDLAMQARGDALNATVYVLPYPLEGLHPNAKAHARHIWCTANPAEAWTAWMKSTAQAGSTEAGRNAAWAGFAARYPAPADCPAAVNVETAQRVGVTLGVSSTPTVVFENGVATEGTNLEEIEQGFAVVEQTMGPYRAAAAAAAPAPAPAPATPAPAPTGQ